MENREVCPEVGKQRSAVEEWKRLVAGDPALQLQTQPAETEYTKNMERPSTSKEKDR